MNKLDVKVEKIKSRYMEKEIFSIGHFEVSVANPNSYFPDVLTEENLQCFLLECRQRYDENFKQLAELSRHSFLFLSSIELKKELMTMYLKDEKTEKIVKKSEISATTIRRLKNKSLSFESLKVATFEKLYSSAMDDFLTPNGWVSK